MTGGNGAGQWELDGLLVQAGLVVREGGQAVRRISADAVQLNNLDELRDYLEKFPDELRAFNERQAEAAAAAAQPNRATRRAAKRGG